MVLAVRSRPHEMHFAIRDMGGTVLSIGELTLVIDKVGLFVNHRTSQPVGVDAWVRLFCNGREVPVDPHRIFINPPLIHNRVFDPRTSFETILWQSVINVPNPKGWRTRGTVTTVFSDTSDGQIDTGDSASYSAARGGTGDYGLNVDDTLTVADAGQRFTSGEYAIYECFISFDTSSIPDTDTVSAAALSLFEAGGGAFTTASTLQARAYNWGASLTSADFRTGDQFNALTLLASIASGSWSSGAYNALTENGTNFQTAVDKAGTTYVCLQTSRYADNNAPTGDEYFEFYQADEAGTTQDPKLTITHASAGVSVTPSIVSTTLTQQTPTVQIGTRVSPAQVATVLTGLAPSVIVNNIVSPAILALALSQKTASVVNPQSASPGVLSTSITQQTPTDTVGVRVLPDVLAVATAQFAPTIQTPVSTTPGVLATALTQQTPSDVVGVNSSPTPLALVTAAFVPTIQTPVSVSPAILALTTSRLTPTVSVSDNQSVTPSIIAVVTSLKGNTVNITLNQQVSPSVLSTVLSGLVPSITNPQSSLPDIGSLITARFVPIILISDISLLFPASAHVKSINTLPSGIVVVDSPVPPGSVTIRPISNPNGASARRKYP